MCDGDGDCNYDVMGIATLMVVVATTDGRGGDEWDGEEEAEEEHPLPFHHATTVADDATLLLLRVFLLPNRSRSLSGSTDALLKGATRRVSRRRSMSTWLASSSAASQPGSTFLTLAARCGSGALSCASVSSRYTNAYQSRSTAP